MLVRATYWHPAPVNVGGLLGKLLIVHVEVAKLKNTRWSCLLRQYNVLYVMIFVVNYHTTFHPCNILLCKSIGYA